MKEFADLYQALDETTKTSLKVNAMSDYFSKCNPADGAWAVHFLSGRRLKRLIPTGLLRTWCAEASGLPDWMFEECYSSVGDLAETMALLLPPGEHSSEHALSHWIEQRIQPLKKLADDDRKTALLSAWSDLDTHERFVFNKLVTGHFRVGVSQGLVIKALAQASRIDPSVLAHRLMGKWEPTPEFFTKLMAEDHGETLVSQPYPFCLAHPLTNELTSLGDISEWLIEWKWDGIRAQVIRREGQTFIWSRGEELIEDRFPEFEAFTSDLPDGTVLDGEIVGWKEGRVLPFSDLQRRIGRKTIGKKILADVPARFITFDMFEWQGDDIRSTPMQQRRQLLEELVEETDDNSRIMLSHTIKPDSWEECTQLREGSRDNFVEGLMLKRRDSVYGVGRPTGLWWKWKVEPYICDAVLIYAQRGSGRRAGLYSDYTFAAWQEGELVPFAKAYSGLTDAEIREVDRFVRRNTLEKFGPVRSVKPELVFELAFENIAPSKRHKSGIAVRFPRMNRWRLDKKPEEADTLELIKSLIPSEGQT